MDKDVYFDGFDGCDPHEGTASVNDLHQRHGSIESFNEIAFQTSPASSDELQASSPLHLSEDSHSQYWQSDVASEIVDRNLVSNVQPSPTHLLEDLPRIFKSFGTPPFNRSQKGPSIVFVDNKLQLYLLPSDAVSDSRTFKRQQALVGEDLVEGIVVGRYKSDEAANTVFEFYCTKVQDYVNNLTTNDGDPFPVTTTTDDMDATYDSAFRLLDVDVENIVQFSRQATVPKDDPHGTFAVVVSISTKRVFVTDIDHVRPKVKLAVTTVSVNDSQQQAILLARYSSRSRAMKFVDVFKETAIVRNNVDFSTFQGERNTQPVYVIHAAPNDSDPPNPARDIVVAINNLSSSLIKAVTEAKQPANAPATCSLDNTLPTYKYVNRAYLENQKLYAGNRFISRVARAIFTVDELKENPLRPMTAKAHEYFKITALFSHSKSQQEHDENQHIARRSLFDLIKKAKADKLPPTDVKAWMESRPTVSR